MTRYLRLPLWTAYAAAVLGVTFLTMVLGNLGLPGAVLPALAAFVGVQEGGFAGGIFGLALGVFGWLTGQGTESILCCALVGVACGGWERHRLRRFGWPCLVSAWLALAFAEGVKVAGRLLFDTAAPTTLLFIAGKELLCALVLTTLVCPLFLLVHRRLGRM